MIQILVVLLALVGFALMMKFKIIPLGMNMIYGGQDSNTINPQGQKTGQKLMFNQTASGGIILNPNIMPSLAELRAQVTPGITLVDVIHKRYWDSVALNSAVAQNWNAFVTPANANYYNSNLFGSNGQLQGSEAMVVTSVRFEVENDSTTNPLNEVLVKEIFRQAYATFIIMNKSYFDIKLMEFLDPRTFLTLNTNYYAARPFVTVPLPVPVIIPPTTAFNFQTSVVNPTLSGSNYRLFCYINGVLYRGVQ